MERNRARTAGSEAPLSINRIYRTPTDIFSALGRLWDLWGHPKGRQPFLVPAGSLDPFLPKTHIVTGRWRGGWKKQPAPGALLPPSPQSNHNSDNHTDTCMHLPGFLYGVCSHLEAGELSRSRYQYDSLRKKSPQTIKVPQTCNHEETFNY